MGRIRKSKRERESERKRESREGERERARVDNDFLIKDSHDHLSLDQPSGDYKTPRLYGQVENFNLNYKLLRMVILSRLKNIYFCAALRSQDWLSQSLIITHRPLGARKFKEDYFKSRTWNLWFSNKITTPL